MENTKEELYKSKDEDAKTGHKAKDSSFFGYKTHIGMTPERIITAATVTSGDKPDGQNWKNLSGKVVRQESKLKQLLETLHIQERIILNLPTEKITMEKKISDLSQN